MSDQRPLLLVEDEADARDLLAQGLSRRGWKVQACADAIEATTYLHQDLVALVTDIVLPRGDGLDLLAPCGERAPLALRVVITSFADKDRAILALNRGADYLLEKPFTVDRLHQVLDQQIEQRRRSVEECLGDIAQERLRSLPLTDHERHLALLVLKGLSNARIAELGQVREQTVKNQIGGMYRKLGIASRAELFHCVLPV